MISWRPVAALSLCMGVALLAPTSVTSQVAVASVDENLRAEPNGARIGVVTEGTRMQVGESRGNWTQVTLDGWMWTRSLQRTDRGEFDLVVSAGEGENLREAPSGRVLARLVRGALLEELEREPGWIHVRRTLWIWSPSLEVSPAPAPPTGADAGAGWLPSGGASRAILTGPDGDTLARAFPLAQLRLLAREGNWARVRMEGWVWAPEAPQSLEGDTAVHLDLEPRDLTGDAATYRGRIVTWRLQYISTERAERVRDDFYEGEPFLLTRPSDGSGGFVYVAVPPEELNRVSSLAPLERITVVGRIRTAAAALTGNPIVELLELRRGG